VASMRYF